MDEAFLDLTEEVNKRRLNGFFPTPKDLTNTVVEGFVKSDSEGFPQ